MSRMLLLVGVALALSGCGASIQLEPQQDPEGFDELDARSMSPDGFVERYGEPDEWMHEDRGAELQMTAVWRCLEGEHREVTWRTASRGSRGQRIWNVVGDVTREGECDSEEK